MPSVPEYKKLLAAGLSPIPLRVGTKRPMDKKWEKYCDEQADSLTLLKWEQEDLMGHLGLCLGTKVGEKSRLIAIDVDAEDLVEQVKYAIGFPDKLCGKFGAKGITIFGLAPLDVENKKIKRKMANGKAEHAPSVEILSHGSQTVVPPSVHPDTGVPYTWWQGAVYDKIDSLPIIDNDTIDEIVALCQNKAEKIIDLNEMVWLGEGKGGNTHDVCVSAVGWMVSRGWSDASIHRRIERAKDIACTKNGDIYSWNGSTHAIQEWINSAKAKGMENSSKKALEKRPPLERVLADWGIEQLGGMENLATVRGQLRRYKDGHFTEVNVGNLQRSMFLQEAHLKEYEAKNAISIMHTMCNKEDFGRTTGYEMKDDPKTHRICMRNGTIDVRTKVLEKWDRDHELLFQLPFDWIDEGECPLWDKLLKDASGGEAQWIETLEEYFALTLVPDTSFQKFLIMHGPGGNGKGTLTSVLAKMHDPNAIGSVSITELDNERKRTSLAGKMVNISGEQSRLNLVSDTYLKKITGEDPVDTRKLYGETDNNVYFIVKFIESLNEMPQTSDNSNALRRRMIILKFRYNIPTIDPDFRKKIHKEIPVIFAKRLVPALNRLYERGQFDPPASSEREIEAYMTSNDPVKMWFQERCEPDDRGTGSTDLYNDFVDWAKKNGFNKPFTSVFWGQQMNRIGLEAKVKKMGSLSVRTRAARLKP